MSLGESNLGEGAARAKASGGKVTTHSEDRGQEGQEAWSSEPRANGTGFYHVGFVLEMGAGISQCKASVPFPSQGAALGEGTSLSL